MGAVIKSHGNLRTRDMALVVSGFSWGSGVGVGVGVGVGSTRGAVATVGRPVIADSAGIDGRVGS